MRAADRQQPVPVAEVREHEAAAHRQQRRIGRRHAHVQLCRDHCAGHRERHRHRSVHRQPLRADRGQRRRKWSRRRRSAALRSGGAGGGDRTVNTTSLPSPPMYEICSCWLPATIAAPCGSPANVPAALVTMVNMVPAGAPKPSATDSVALLSVAVPLAASRSVLRAGRGAVQFDRQRRAHAEGDVARRQDAGARAWTDGPAGVDRDGAHGAAAGERGAVLHCDRTAGLRAVHAQRAAGHRGGAGVGVGRAQHEGPGPGLGQTPAAGVIVGSSRSGLVGNRVGDGLRLSGTRSERGRAVALQEDACSKRPARVSAAAACHGAPGDRERAGHREHPTLLDEDPASQSAAATAVASCRVTPGEAAAAALAPTTTAAAEPASRATTVPVAAATAKPAIPARSNSFAPPPPPNPPFPKMAPTPPPPPLASTPPPPPPPWAPPAPGELPGTPIPPGAPPAAPIAMPGWPGEPNKGKPGRKGRNKLPKPPCAPSPSPPPPPPPPSGSL